MRERDPETGAEILRQVLYKGHMVKHGLDWTSKTWTGLISKTWTGLISKTWTGLKRVRLVKHGLDSISKTWTGLKSVRLVKHGL